MDDDLADMNREQLAADVRKLRDAIRRHRDSSGHALCWHHPDIWNLLPERTDQQPPGRNPCAVAFVTGNPSTGSFPMRRAMTRLTRSRD